MIPDEVKKGLHEQRIGLGRTSPLFPMGEVSPAGVDTGFIRQFPTGATRDTAEGKLDFEGFLSPAVLQRYAEYMHKNRVQADGSLRSADNWQKGIPRQAYMSSMFRHFMQVWREYRMGDVLKDEAREEALCALLFNVMGLLFEVLNRRNP